MRIKALALVVSVAGATLTLTACEGLQEAFDGSLPQGKQISEVKTPEERGSFSPSTTEEPGWASTNPTVSQRQPVTSSSLEPTQAWAAYNNRPVSTSAFPTSKHPANDTPPWTEMHQDGYQGDVDTACRLLGLGGPDEYFCQKYKRLRASEACRVVDIPNGVVLDGLTFTHGGRDLVQNGVSVRFEKEPETRQTKLCYLGNGIYVGQALWCNNHFRVDTDTSPRMTAWTSTTPPRRATPAPPAPRIKATSDELHAAAVPPDEPQGKCPHPDEDSIREGYRVIRICLWAPSEATAQLDWFGTGSGARDLWPQIVRYGTLSTEPRRDTLRFYGMNITPQIRANRPFYVRDQLGNEVAYQFPDAGDRFEVDVPYTGYADVSVPVEALTENFVVKFKSGGCTTYPPAGAQKLYRTRPGEISELVTKPGHLSERLHPVGCR